MGRNHSPPVHSRLSLAVRRNTLATVPDPQRLLLLFLVAVIGLAVTGAILGKVYQSPQIQLPALQFVGAAAASQRTQQVAAGPTAITAGTARGACLAFGPLRGERYHMVNVEPDHGGIDRGHQALQVPI